MQIATAVYIRALSGTPDSTHSAKSAFPLIDYIYNRPQSKHYRIGAKPHSNLPLRIQIGSRIKSHLKRDSIQSCVLSH